jgi:hypothetical protein
VGGWVYGGSEEKGEGDCCAFETVTVTDCNCN